MAKILLINQGPKFPTYLFDNWSNRNPLHQLVVIQDNSLTFKSIIREHSDAEILLANYNDYSSEILSCFTNLKAIIATTTAVEYIDNHYCTSKNISIYNTKNYTQSSVAEHLLTLLLSVSRKLPLLSNQSFEGMENHEGSLGMELANKNIGILGLGNIGQTFASMVYHLGMKVSYYNRSTKLCHIANQINFDQLIETSDVLACTLPLTDQTRYLCNRSVLEKTKKGAIIVSISPDEIFDIYSLQELLAQGHLFGVGLDLHSSQFLNGFLVNPNLNFMLTRTKAWYTSECLVRRTKGFLSKLDEIT